MSTLVGIMSCPHGSDVRIKTRFENQHFFKSIDLNAPIKNSLEAMWGRDISVYEDKSRRNSPLPFNANKTYNTMYDAMKKFMIAVGGPRALRDAAERTLENTGGLIVIYGLETKEDAEWAAHLGSAIVVPRHPKVTPIELPMTTYELRIEGTPQEMGEATDELYLDIQKFNRLILRRERGEPVQAI